jgi:hypothetical protein
LSREFWATATPVRDIFKKAFREAGLPAFVPHSFRHMLVQIAYQRKLSLPVLKAWSQNLGHEGLLTTLTSYGTIPLELQGQLIADSPRTAECQDEMDEAIEIARILMRRKRR